MKLYRYMNSDEFLKVLSGEKLKNTNTFENCRTDSEGFCFLGELTDVDGYKWPPENCIRFLSGIVSDEVLVEFEAPDNMTDLKEGYGVYANPYTDFWDDYIRITEYSIKEYDKSILKPCRALLYGDMVKNWNTDKILEITCNSEIKDDANRFNEICEILDLAEKAEYERIKNNEKCVWYDLREDMPKQIQNLVQNRKLNKKLQDEEKVISETEELLEKRNRIKKQNKNFYR